jgi:hypothetical protein
MSGGFQDLGLLPELVKATEDLGWMYVGSERGAVVDAARREGRLSVCGVVQAAKRRPRRDHSADDGRR